MPAMRLRGSAGSRRDGFNMRRLLVLIVGILATWLGPATPAMAAATAPTNLEIVYVYAYDGHHHTLVPTYTTTERGPPRSSDRCTTTYGAVDRWLHGASARQDEPTPRVATTYDEPTKLVQVAQATGTTKGQAQVVCADTSSLASGRVAANGGIRALPSGPKIAAEWGADTYRHGGLMSTIEHVNYRHAYGSGFSGVSRYAEGTSVRDIKGYVDYVLRNGSVTDRGMIGNVGRTIGTDAAGNPVTGLEIIVRDGHDQDRLPCGGAVMTLPPLQDFINHEADDFVRSELLSAIDQLKTGQRYFTYNTFNVLLDADAQLATVEDELDVERAETVALDAFAELLRGPT